MGKIEYALYVPKQLLSTASKKTYEWVLNTIPIVSMDSSGEYARKLDEIACKSKLKINFRLECESFPAICHAVQSGCYAGILPTMASKDLPEDKFVCIEALPFKKLSREIALAWNPRIMRLRSASAEIALWFEKHL